MVSGNVVRKQFNRKRGKEMIKEVRIENGDMISMAKVVNGNTVATHNKMCTIENNLKELGKCYNGYIKHNNRNVKKLALCSILLGAAILMQDRQIKKLEKQVKKLDDRLDMAEFDKYYDTKREEAEEDCLK